MSKEDLVEAYAEGRITRRTFVKGMAALGGAFAAAITLDSSPAEGQVAPAKKAPPAKKPTTPPGLD